MPLQHHVALHRVEKEIKEVGKTWEGIKPMTKDRQMCRTHIAALYATGHKGHRLLNIALIEASIITKVPRFTQSKLTE